MKIWGPVCTGLEKPRPGVRGSGAAGARSAGKGASALGTAGAAEGAAEGAEEGAEGAERQARTAARHLVEDEQRRGLGLWHLVRAGTRRAHLVREGRWGEAAGRIRGRGLQDRSRQRGKAEGGGMEK
jgi:hypothetical protein